LRQLPLNIRNSVLAVVTRPRQSLAAIAYADPEDSLCKIFRMTDTCGSVNGKIWIADCRLEISDLRFLVGAFI
jgi:hypothetical protein